MFSSVFADSVIRRYEERLVSLEISLSCYSHFLSRHRVLKCDFLCMKMQSCCRLVAVERIADDRGIQTFPDEQQCTLSWCVLPVLG